MADINAQNPKFIDFMFNGLDHGIYSISDSGGPLIPFIMIQTGDTKEMKRFVTERYEEGVAAAEKALAEMQPKPDFGLIAFDGFITWEEKKYDAVIVRAFDKTQDEGFEFCQRYVPKEDGNGIEPTGNSAFIGKSENILLENPSPKTEPAKEPQKKKPWWKF